MATTPFEHFNQGDFVMMAGIFTALGVLVGAAGALWAGPVLQNLGSHHASIEIYTAVVTAAPGLWVIAFGLVLIAIGSLLHHLDRIERNTALTVRAFSALIDRNV
jgi:hypothetical protein